MGDYLVDLGANPHFRQVVKTLGLPLPLLQKLARAKGPWAERELVGKPVVVGGVGEARLTGVLSEALAAAGAAPHVAGGTAAFEAYQAHGEAWGTPPRAINLATWPDSLVPHAMVFDATGLKKTEQLKSAYEFFHAGIKRLRPCGRLLILADNPEETKNPATAAARRALEGLMRAMGREVGRRGATSNLIYVAAKAKPRVAPFVRFLLSRRAAFVSGQPLFVDSAVKPAPTPIYRRPLEGRVALVTGSARGIGEAIARAFAREGAKVIVMDRPAESEAAARLAAELNGELLSADITDPDAPAALAGTIKAKFGKLDIVVHNAGVTRDKMLGNMDEARWDMVLDVNLIRLIAVNEALVPLMPDGARIVALSSIAGIAGNMGQTNYATSKAGVIGYVRALAEKLADRGITVNALAPGFIETRMTAAIPLGTREAGRRLANLSQGGLPQDIAEVATFLCSPGAVGMTGRVLRVCGGSFLGA